MQAPDISPTRWTDQPAAEDHLSNAAAYARQCYEQCGQGPLTLYTTSTTLAEKLRTISGYPQHDLGARAHRILQAASTARHNLEPDQVEAINKLLAATGTTLNQLLTQQQPRYAADHTDPVRVAVVCDRMGGVR